MNLHIDPSYLIFAIPMRNIRKTIQALRPVEKNFNHLSVTNATNLHQTDEILIMMDKVSCFIKNYGEWRHNALARVDQAKEKIEEMFAIATVLNEKPQIIPIDDARSLLHLDAIDKDFVPAMTNLWFTLHCTNNGTAYDYPIGVYQRMLVYLMWNVVTILDSVCTVFKVKSEIQPFSMLGYEIHPGIDPGCEAGPDEIVPVFTYHDEVVAFSPEEIEAQRQRDEAAAQEAARQREIEEKRQEVMGHIQTILKCYKRHKDAGNLPRFSLTGNALAMLENPSDIKACETCEAFYRFLMAMSESVRYMPGDQGSDSDRIMGSFMELDNNIVRDKERFTIYLHSYGMTHNDICMTLDLFENDIVAQYIDSKEFIDELKENPTSPKSIHLFVQ